MQRLRCSLHEVGFLDAPGRAHPALAQQRDEGAHVHRLERFERRRRRGRLRRLRRRIELKAEADTAEREERREDLRRTIEEEIVRNEEAASLERLQNERHGYSRADPQKDEVEDPAPAEHDAVDESSSSGIVASRYLFRKLRASPATGQSIATSRPVVDSVI